MKKGFSKADITVLQKKITNVHTAFEELKLLLTSKIDDAEVWIEERSEAWQESEKCEEFEDWISELDSLRDELDGMKDEVNIDLFDEVL